MIAILVAAQVVLPLLMLLWLALQPAASRLGFALQVAGIGALLLSMAWAAPWTVVPWWLPRVHGTLWAAATLWHVLHGRAVRVTLLPARSAGWTAAALSAAMLVIGAWLGGAAFMGRGLPEAPVLDVVNPLGPGRYLVGNGGGNELVNPHLRTLDPAVERYRPWRGQSYAIDFVGLNRWGSRAAGLSPSHPSAYAIFGAAVHAPCAGQVMAVESDLPDLEIPNQDVINRLGNHLILQCGDAVVVLAHLKRGSIAATAGRAVVVGDLLGEVGNSGASTEPHLHIHAQRQAAGGEPPISGEPIALRIDGRFLVRNDRINVRERRDAPGRRARGGSGPALIIPSSGRGA